MKHKARRIRELEERVRELEMSSALGKHPDYMFQTILIDFDKRTITRDNQPWVDASEPEGSSCVSFVVRR